MPLLLVLAWTTFAFAGVYASTLAVPALLVLGLAIAYRPRVLHRGPSPHFDRWILVALATAVAQTVPLPQDAVRVVTPAAAKVAAELSLPGAAGATPISVDLKDSAAAVGLFAGMVLLFFTAREVFDTGGVRTVARGTAIIGLVLAAVAIAQDATGDGLMYWRWSPTFDRTDPFGPFVNRNHFGTWAIMAIPLTIGYLTAHATAHRHNGPVVSWRQRLIAVLDGRAALLVACAALMIVAVVLSLSRSAMLGLGAAMAFGGWLSRRGGAAGRVSQARPAMIVAVLALITGALIVIRVPPAQVVDRVSGVRVAVEDRVTIWRETVPIVRDFWMTGTGVGTYQTAMAVYQRSDKGLIYNQAHNHYLQVAAEGGLLVGFPVAIGLFLLAREGAAALARDRSGMYWLRAGAASGLVGVGVQNALEAGLLTPANGVLAALVAAILVHVPGRYGPPRVR